MKIKTKTTRQKVWKEVEEDTVEYTLTLTHEEACALKAVLGKITGDPGENSPRRHTSAIYSALNGVGLLLDHPDVFKYGKQVTQNMRIGPPRNDNSW